MVSPRPRIVISADGLWSRVARIVDAPFEIQQPSRSCGYYAYWTGVPTDGVEFYRRHGPGHPAVSHP